MACHKAVLVAHSSGLYLPVIDQMLYMSTMLMDKISTEGVKQKVKENRGSVGQWLAM